MNTDVVQAPRKKGGKPSYFSEGIENEIARRYYLGKESARSLADEFRKLAPAGELSRSSIRAIAKRAYPRIHAEPAA